MTTLAHHENLIRHIERMDEKMIPVIKDCTITILAEPVRIPERYREHLPCTPLELKKQELRREAQIQNCLSCLRGWEVETLTENSNLKFVYTRTKNNEVPLGMTVRKLNSIYQRLAKVEGTLEMTMTFPLGNESVGTYFLPFLDVSIEPELSLFFLTVVAAKGVDCDSVKNELEKKLKGWYYRTEETKDGVEFVYKKPETEGSTLSLFSRKLAVAYRATLNVPGVLEVQGTFPVNEWDDGVFTLQNPNRKRYLK